MSFGSKDIRSTKSYNNVNYRKTFETKDGTTSTLQLYENNVCESTAAFYMQKVFFLQCFLNLLTSTDLKVAI